MSLSVPPTNQRPQASNSDPLKQHASIVVIIRFIDGNSRTFYSRDIDKKGTWMYKHVGYWVQYWKYRIEKETPAGWTGRVDEAAIFHCFDGNRGDKICQFSKSKGGWQL
jgi:hypothetical protein